MKLSLVTGGDADLVSHEGERLVLLFSRAFPPGSTLELVLGGAPLKVKVKSCRLSGEGLYSIQGRCVNLSREQREKLSSSGA